MAAWLESTPLPTLKDENWRYTSLRGIDFDAFAPVTGGTDSVRTATVLGCIATGWHVSAQPLVRVSLCFGGTVGRSYATSAR